MKRIIALLILISSYSIGAQSNRLPGNGSNGIQGQALRSFVLSWAPVAGAVKYEYILTTNPDCFEGCAGDTRQKFASDTTSLEYDLEENTWYYWIVRYYYDETNYSGWAPIYSFLAKYEEVDGILRMFPNPVSDPYMHAYVDWSVNPDLATFQAEFVDCYGKTKVKSPVFEKTAGFKYELFLLDIATLGTGLYTCSVTMTNAGGNKYERILKKIVIP